MAEIVHTDCKLWMDGYDLTGYTNAIAINYGADIKEVTTFGDDTHTNTGGLKSVEVAHEGYWDGTTQDPATFGLVGVNDKPMTMAPTTGAAGEPAYFFKSALSQYSTGEAVGEVLPFSVSGQASDGDLIRGTILINGTAVAASSSTSGTQLGAVSATQSVHASLHVTSASGTLDVVVQSDVDNTFATPANQITFTQATAIGSEILSTAGAITDTWWRIDYTVSGTFSFIVAVGIQ